MTFRLGIPLLMDAHTGVDQESYAEVVLLSGEYESPNEAWEAAKKLTCKARVMRRRIGDYDERGYNWVWLRKRPSFVSVTGEVLKDPWTPERVCRAVTIA